MTTTVIELVAVDGTLTIAAYEPLRLVMPIREPLVTRVTEYLMAYGQQIQSIVEVHLRDPAAVPIAKEWQRLAPAAVKIVKVEHPQQIAENGAANS